MDGIDENVVLNGDWGLPNPSPRTLFSRMLDEESNSVTRQISEQSESDRIEVQDGDSGTQLSDGSYRNDHKLNSRGGLVERIAARTGFNAPRLNTEGIRSTELSLNSEIQSPYLTIPLGLSPATLLDSPVFLANSLAQPSPTTGKFPFVSNGNIRGTELSSDDQQKSKLNGFNDMYASSFAFKPAPDTGPFFYHGAGRNINQTTLPQQTLHSFEASVQSQRVDATENKSSLHLKAEFSDSPPQKDNSAPMEDQAEENGTEKGISQKNQQMLPQILANTSEPTFHLRHALSTNGSDSVRRTHKCCVYIAGSSKYCARLNSIQAYNDINQNVIGEASHLSEYSFSAHNNIIDPTAELGAKTTVGPHCMLGEGSQMGDKCSVKRSVIGRHCRIGADVKVVNSVVMNHVTIGDLCSIQGSVICSNVQLQERAILKDCQVGAGFVVTAGSECKGEVLANK
ncbi:unnamed protein product [Lathyrus sativus]|nr:unnamed protein product [Lathyrus sativus]